MRGNIKGVWREVGHVPKPGRGRGIGSTGRQIVNTCKQEAEAGLSADSKIHKYKFELKGYFHFLHQEGGVLLRGGRRAGERRRQNKHGCQGKCPDSSD